MIVRDLAIFPLTSHVLPEGRLPLRIFEPRYVRMIREAMLEDAYIGMGMLIPQRDLGPADNVCSIVTLAKIVDFSSLEDGLLGIEVEGKHLGSVTGMDVESDGLRRASVDVLPPFESIELVECYERLSTGLSALYREYPELGKLYHSPRWQDITWVCLRWLEVLPIKTQEKQRLIQTSSHDIADYLLTLLKEDSDSTLM